MYHIDSSIVIVLQGNINNKGNWGRLEGYMRTLYFLFNFFCKIKTAPFPPPPLPQKKKIFQKNLFPMARPQEVRGHEPGVVKGTAALSTIPLYLWGCRPETWHILSQSITFHVYFCDLPQQSQLSSMTFHSSPWQHLARVQCLVYLADGHMNMFYRLRPGIC